MVEWFYAKNNQQFGPVSSGELKQLARDGQLTREDLVWRHGMEQWTGAGRVKGLFEAEAPAAEAAPAPSSPLPAPAPTPPCPPVTAAAEPPVGQTPSVQDSPPSVKIELPTPAVVRNEDQGVFDGAPPMPRRSPRPRARHVLDYLLEAAKRGLSASFVEATARTFRGFGHVGLYAAMLLVLWLALLTLTEPKLRMGAILILMAIPLLALLQYVARRFLEALERLNRATLDRLDSSAVLDCFALLSLFAGAAGLVVLAIEAVQTHKVSTVLSAAAVFIVGQYLAVLAINPGVLRISIGPTGGAGAEALALLGCGLKMLTVGLMPVAFGIGVVCGTVQLAYALVLQLMAVKGEALPELDTAFQAITVLCGSAFLPVAAYVVFLALHLGIEVLRGLTHLADWEEEPIEPGPPDIR